MTSIRTFTAFSLLIAAFASPLFSAEPPADKDASPAENVATEKPLPPFTISEETTRLTEPLRADGRVDYVAALNKFYSEGVTPENNAVVLILQAFGPDVEPLGTNVNWSEFRDENFRMLGIRPLPEKGDYLIPYEKFESDIPPEQPEEEEGAQGFNAKPRQLDQFNKTMESPWTAAKHPRYAAWMKANEKPLEKILEASQRPKYYAPLISSDSEYAAIISVLLPLSYESRQCARLLAAHAMLSIGEGKLEDARRDLLTCHRLARLVGQGPTSVDGLVAISIDGIACKADATLAQSDKLTAQMAFAYREELKKLPPMPKMSDKIDTSERYTFLDSVEMMAVKGVDSIIALTGEGVPKSKDRSKKSTSSLPVFMPSDCDMVLRMGNSWYDRMVQAASLLNYSERQKAFQEIGADIKKISDVKSLKGVGTSLMAGEALHTIHSRKLGNILIALLTPALGALIGSEERGNVYSDLSQIALALGAYRSDHDNYPDRLADLAPKYVAEMPKDGFSGREFMYRHEGKGYILYSVGLNGKDDHGMSTNNDPPDEEGDDFVVRTPKEAE